MAYVLGYEQSYWPRENREHIVEWAFAKGLAQMQGWHILVVQ